MPRNFPALPGFYHALFLYFESLTTISPAFLAWFFPGAEWFHAQLIPADTPSEVLDARTTMRICQLALIAWFIFTGYMLLGLISSLVFRAIRDTLPNNPGAQEHILGASMTALALADVSLSCFHAESTRSYKVTHILASWVGLPEYVRYSFRSWNSVTHGNITFVIFLFSMRLAWFAGIGRQRYYYGNVTPKHQKAA